MRSKTDLTSLGYGFVKFRRGAEAQAAIEAKNGLCMMGKKLKVSMARPSSAEIKNSKLYVANLPKDYEENDILAMFSPYGTIIEVRLLRDRLTNAPKGVAFVQFDLRSEAEHALIDVPITHAGLNLTVNRSDFEAKRSSAVGEAAADDQSIGSVDCHPVGPAMMAGKVHSPRGRPPNSSTRKSPAEQQREYPRQSESDDVKRDHQHLSRQAVFPHRDGQSQGKGKVKLTHVHNLRAPAHQHPTANVFRQEHGGNVYQVVVPTSSHGHPHRHQYYVPEYAYPVLPPGIHGLHGPHGVVYELLSPEGAQNELQGEQVQGLMAPYFMDLGHNHNHMMMNRGAAIYLRPRYDEDSNDAVEATLTMTNLPPQTDVALLYDLVAPFGHVLSAEIDIVKAEGDGCVVCSGRGYVKLQGLKSAQDAVQALNGGILHPDYRLPIQVTYHLNNHSPGSQRRSRGNSIASTTSNTLPEESVKTDNIAAAVSPIPCPLTSLNQLRPNTASPTLTDSSADPPSPRKCAEVAAIVNSDENATGTADYGGH